MVPKVTTATRLRDGAVIYFGLDGEREERLDTGRGAEMKAEAAMRLAAVECGTDRVVRGLHLIERAAENGMPHRSSNRGRWPRDEEPASVVCAAYWAY